MGSGSDYVTPTFADNIYNKTMQKRGWDLPSLFAKPCIAEQAGGALAAISHIDFTYRFHISISHIDFTYHCKIGSQFFREWRTAHTPLRPLLRLASIGFGLFFDWLRLASIGFGLFFVWAIGTLDKAHDHELRNPVSLGKEAQNHQT